MQSNSSISESPSKQSSNAQNATRKIADSIGSPSSPKISDTTSGQTTPDDGKRNDIPLCPQEMNSCYEQMKLSSGRLSHVVPSQILYTSAQTSTAATPSADGGTPLVGASSLGSKVTVLVDTHAIFRDDGQSLGHCFHKHSEKIVEISPNGLYARLNRILGKGAYKIVWKAIDLQTGTEVAWNQLQVKDGKPVRRKPLDPSYRSCTRKTNISMSARISEGVNTQESADSVSRSDRLSPSSRSTKLGCTGHTEEIEILRRVSHPNIIRSKDSWFTNLGEFVFITELMDSGTLREYIERLSGNVTVGMVRRWSRQILQGLLYLHSLDPPIIHRDLKCDNIFINGAHGEVKIGDLGTAKMKVGRAFTLIGTPEFMAPEMYEERGYDEKVDVYAFGMVLLELATGAYPYLECQNAAQIYKKVSTGQKPECLNAVTNPQIKSLITACLASEEERPTVRDILQYSSFYLYDPIVTLLTTDEVYCILNVRVISHAILDDPSVDVSAAISCFDGCRYSQKKVVYEFNLARDTPEKASADIGKMLGMAEDQQRHVASDLSRLFCDFHSKFPFAMETIQQRLKSTAQGLRPVQTAFASNAELDRLPLSIENLRASNNSSDVSPSVVSHHLTLSAKNIDLHGQAEELQLKLEELSSRADLAESQVKSIESILNLQMAKQDKMENQIKLQLGRCRELESVNLALYNELGRLQAKAGVNPPILHSGEFESQSNGSNLVEGLESINGLSSHINRAEGVVDDSMSRSQILSSGGDHHVEKRLPESVMSSPPSLPMLANVESSHYHCHPSKGDFPVDNHIMNVPPLPTTRSYSPANANVNPNGPPRVGMTSVPLIYLYYDMPIEDFVFDVATQSQRNPAEAARWISLLRAHDIFSLSDLRQLHDEDWNQLHLSVFAIQALKSALY